MVCDRLRHAAHFHWSHCGLVDSKTPGSRGEMENIRRIPFTTSHFRPSSSSTEKKEKEIKNWTAHHLDPVDRVVYPVILSPGYTYSAISCLTENAVAIPDHRICLDLCCGTCIEKNASCMVKKKAG